MAMSLGQGLCPSGPGSALLERIVECFNSIGQHVSGAELANVVSVVVNPHGAQGAVLLQQAPEERHGALSIRQHLIQVVRAGTLGLAAYEIFKHNLPSLCETVLRALGAKPGGSEVLSHKDLDRLRPIAAYSNGDLLAICHVDQPLVPLREAVPRMNIAEKVDVVTKVASLVALVERAGGFIAHLSPDCLYVYERPGSDSELRPRSEYVVAVPQGCVRLTSGGTTAHDMAVVGDGMDASPEQVVAAMVHRVYKGELADLLVEGGGQLPNTAFADPDDPAHVTELDALPVDMCDEPELGAIGGEELAGGAAQAVDPQELWASVNMVREMGFKLGNFMHWALLGLKGFYKELGIDGVATWLAAPSRCRADLAASPADTTVLRAQLLLLCCYNYAGMRSTLERYLQANCPQLLQTVGGGGGADLRSVLVLAANKLPQASHACHPLDQVMGLLLCSRHGVGLASTQVAQLIQAAQQPVLEFRGVGDAERELRDLLMLPGGLGASPQHVEKLLGMVRQLCNVDSPSRATPAASLHSALPSVYAEDEGALQAMFLLQLRESSLIRRLVMTPFERAVLQHAHDGGSSKLVKQLRANAAQRVKFVKLLPADQRLVAARLVGAVEGEAQLGELVRVSSISTSRAFMELCMFKVSKQSFALFQAVMDSWGPAVATQPQQSAAPASGSSGQRAGAIRGIITGLTFRNFSQAAPPAPPAPPAQPGLLEQWLLQCRQPAVLNLAHLSASYSARVAAALAAAASAVPAVPAVAAVAAASAPAAPAAAGAAVGPSALVHGAAAAEQLAASLQQPLPEGGLPAQAAVLASIDKVAEVAKGVADAGAAGKLTFKFGPLARSSVQLQPTSAQLEQQAREAFVQGLKEAGQRIKDGAAQAGEYAPAVTLVLRRRVAAADVEAATAGAMADAAAAGKVLDCLSRAGLMQGLGQGELLLQVEQQQQSVAQPAPVSHKRGRSATASGPAAASTASSQQGQGAHKEEQEEEEEEQGRSRRQRVKRAGK